MCHQWRFAFHSTFVTEASTKMPMTTIRFFFGLHFKIFWHMYPSLSGQRKWRFELAPSHATIFTLGSSSRVVFLCTEWGFFFDYYGKIELRILLLWWSIGRGDHLSCWKQMNPKLWMKGVGLLIDGSGRHYWAAAFYKRNLGQSGCDGCEMTTPKDRPLVDFIGYKCLLVVQA